MTTMTTHTLTMAARCPVDDARDIYEVVVTTDRMLAVETILMHVARLSETPRYQEVITEELAAALDANVTTTGTHSGVLTVCVVTR